MKISIDTLPLWDAFKQKDICPFCHLEVKLESIFVDAFLGESVMEPDTRVLVNAKGFCQEHFKQMYRSKSSKLGLALMAHTHLKDTIAALEKAMENSPEAAAAEAAARARSCAVCERTASHMARYLETALHMWQNDKDFKALFDACEGFCIPHWGTLLRMGGSAVPGRKRAEFIGKLSEIEKKALSALEGDLEWFTRKFDYRNAGEPWGNAKDALPRAIHTLEGYTPGLSDS
jgi:hypothetical protein